MDNATLTALGLTLRVAGAATALVLVPCTLIAYALARYEFRGKALLSSLFGLPLVLPPTAVGYLLLKTLGNSGPLGPNVLGFDLGILLTWKGAVLASSIMASPLVVRTARVTFEGIDPRLEMMARTLGYSRSEAFLRYTIPLARRGLLAAAILGFTRAVGEFGATVMLAGNIPGRTQTLSLAIYSAQQAGEDLEAYVLLGVALAVGFIAILASEKLARAPLGAGSARWAP